MPSGSARSRTQSSSGDQNARVEEDDREVQHLARLDQRQRLEQLVGGAESAGEDDEALRRLHEHRLARVEVPEGQQDVEVRVRSLLVRQLDVEADREAAALAAAAVRRLHHAGAAARDDCPARPRRRGVRSSRASVVRRRALVHARRAEDRDRGPVDPLDGHEARRRTRPRSAPWSARSSSGPPRAPRAGVCLPSEPVGVLRRDHPGHEERPRGRRRGRR